MSREEAVRRLRKLAAEEDDRADALYRQARRRTMFSSTHRNEAVRRRGAAEFLTQLADGVEAAPEACSHSILQGVV